VVIHHWGLPGQTHDGVVDFFVNGPGETSAHFVVSAGRITCLVAPEDAAWHCPGKNATHIGIECRPEATAADYATVAELVAWLRATYALPLPLSKHRDWYNTACPGVWDLARIDRLTSSAITAQSATTKPQEDTLSAAEVNKIIAAVQADGDKTRDYLKKLAYSGWQDDAGKKHPGFMLVIEENQKRIDAIKAAVTK
jgi:N-acetylmuramoyl-L-alanine amidase CwlA